MFSESFFFNHCVLIFLNLPPFFVVPFPLAAIYVTYEQKVKINKYVYKGKNSGILSQKETMKRYNKTSLLMLQR